MELNVNAIAPENERIIREIGIPPCPQVLIELMKEVRSDGTDLKKISHLISKDVGLSAAVVKTANSTFYGLRHKAGSIQAALFAVGLRSAANLIAGLMLRRAFASMDAAVMKGYWETTSRVSLTAAFLGRELGIADISRAHTFALFRDCGVPLLMCKFTDYRDVIKAAEAQGSPQVTDVEAARWEVDHASIGASLARSWFLPDDIWQSIQRHHASRNLADNAGAKAGVQEQLVALGMLADCLLSRHRGAVISARGERDEALALSLLGVTEEDLEPLQADIDRILSGE